MWFNLLTSSASASQAGIDAGQITKPIIELIKSLAGPAIGLVAAIGILYCILLGVKLAKAEEPQDREKAKGALKNAIIGFLLIFVLIVVLFEGVPLMVGWLGSATSLGEMSTGF